MRPAQLLLGAACLAIVGHARQAHAYERQWHVGGSFGYVFAPFPVAGATHGFGGGAHVAYGVSDAFNLRVNLDVLGFSVAEPQAENAPVPPEGIPHHAATVWSGTVGAEYVLDILEWVPYFGLALGFADVVQPPTGAASGERLHDPNLAFEIPFGIAYLPIPELSVGLEGRYRVLALGSSPRTPVQMILAGARLEYVWGY
ncbi:MAG: hypothetical protein IT373_07370 [Polyangiaceae bacterium]|nr:hypothetical protein [Polyangiaceae bacterium]